MRCNPRCSNLMNKEKDSKQETMTNLLKSNARDTDAVNPNRVSKMGVGVLNAFITMVNQNQNGLDLSQDHTRHKNLSRGSFWFLPEAASRNSCLAHGILPYGKPLRVSKCRFEKNVFCTVFSRMSNTVQNTKRQTAWFAFRDHPEINRGNRVIYGCAIRDTSASAAPCFQSAGCVHG